MSPTLQAEVRRDRTAPPKPHAARHATLAPNCILVWPHTHACVTARECVTCALCSVVRLRIRGLSIFWGSQVLTKVNFAWINKVKWLAGGFPPFLAEVILALRPAVFAPKERVGSSALYILHAGIAIYGGRVMKAGAVWGEDMLLASPHLRSREHARSVTYLEVYFLERDFVLQIVQSYEETRIKLFRYIHFMALRRYVVLIAKAKRQVKRSVRCSMKASGSAQPQPAEQLFHHFSGSFKSVIGDQDMTSSIDAIDVHRERQLNRALFRLASVSGDIQQLPQAAIAAASDEHIEALHEDHDDCGASKALKLVVPGTQAGPLHGSLGSGRAAGGESDWHAVNSSDMGLRLDAMHRETLAAIGKLRAEVTDLRLRVNHRLPAIRRDELDDLSA